MLRLQHASTRSNGAGESPTSEAGDPNAHQQTVIVAPLTSSGKPYPFRVPCFFDKKQGLIVLDQIRTVDRERLLRRLGAISGAELDGTLALLREMFEA